MGYPAEAGQPVLTIVTDTGPLIHLHEISALDLLGGLGNVMARVTVAREFLHGGTTGAGNLPESLKVQRLSPSARSEARRLEAVGQLHRGEAEALVLAQRLQANWLATDDAAARTFARSLRVEVHGSLGIVLAATARGAVEISRAEEMLDRLAASSLYISREVISQAKNALASLTRTM